MRRWLVIVFVGALALALISLVSWDLVVALNLPDGRDKLRGELLGLLVPIAGAIAGAGALFNFVNSRAGLKETQQQNRDQLELNRRGQLTERFGKAIDQLGQGSDPHRDVRIGGIYALEQIARDSAELHGPVIEVLTAFLREHRPLSGAPGPDTAPAKPPADIQAAVTVVGRRNPEQDRGSIDLSFTDLGRANLSRANLDGADLTSANLRGAELYMADLRGASLVNANLRGANLRKANLEGAVLEFANFQGADLVSANVRSANLSSATLEGTTLNGANLEGAVLLDASITRHQLALAITDSATVGPSSPTPNKQA